MSESTFHCFSCNADLKEHLLSPIGRSAVCDKCLADIRCCKNCKEFDESLYNSCKETEADRIVDKEKANFCDWFKPNLAGGRAKAEESKADKFAELDKLFK